MPERADAHIHLFEGGYHASFAGRPGVSIDEGACYDSLARDHGVSAALIVAYAAAEWCTQNNAYLARMVTRYSWVKPTAYFDAGAPPDLAELESLAGLGFVGLSFYLHTEQNTADLARIDDAVWAWLVAHGWVISCNSRGERWADWRPILERHGELKLLASHLGSPPRVASPPSAEEARAALAVLPLAEYPGPRVKLSGFYGCTDPSYDYPHTAAWPYVEALAERFGTSRLLWASDFSPCLDHQTFPQTLNLFAKMPFLSDADREAIEGGNLLGLLSEVRR